jgi:hypothetical protein
MIAKQFRLYENGFVQCCAPVSGSCRLMSFASLDVQKRSVRSEVH